MNQMSSLVSIDVENIEKMSKELINSGKTISRHQARELVHTYYELQDYRMGLKNQARALSESERPNSFVDWLGEQMSSLEKQIGKALKKYADNDPVCIWAQSIPGIAHTLSAGLSAYIDITKAPTAGHIWIYAGIDPSRKWLGREKSEKLFTEIVGKKGKPNDSQILEIGRRMNIRPESAFERFNGKTRAEIISNMARIPWNADLKKLCWKIGESFVKVSNNPNDYYGKIYRLRKEYENKKNEAGEYADQAKQKLEKFNIGKDTDAYAFYSIGKLPPAHIQSRVKRYAVKIFLSHWHQVAYELHYGEKAPKPFALAILGHAHILKFLIGLWRNKNISHTGLVGYCPRAQV